MKTETNNTETKSQNDKEDFGDVFAAAHMFAQLLTPPKREPQQICTTNIHVTVNIYPDKKSFLQKLTNFLKRK